MTAKILFADDDRLMRRLYQRHIEQAGFELVEANNGREALEAVARERPRLAIVDFLMPEIDGLSVVLELKRTEATKDIPVIVISSDAKSYQYKKQFVEAGATAFLPKPFGASQLLQSNHCDVAFKLKGPVQTFSNAPVDITSAQQRDGLVGRVARGPIGESAGSGSIAAGAMARRWRHVRGGHHVKPRSSCHPAHFRGRRDA